jgi:hypothetical protein
MNFHLKKINTISCDTLWVFMGYLSSIMRGKRKRKKEKKLK